MVAIFQIGIGRRESTKSDWPENSQWMHGYTQGIYEYLNIWNTRHRVSYQIIKAWVEKPPQFCLIFTVYAFTFQEYIAQRSPDFRKTFVKFDSDGDGKISRKEFRMVGINLVLVKGKIGSKKMISLCGKCSCIYLFIYLFLTSAGVGQSGSIHEWRSISHSKREVHFLCCDWLILRARCLLH